MTGLNRFSMAALATISFGSVADAHMVLHRDGAGAQDRNYALVAERGAPVAERQPQLIGTVRASYSQTVMGLRVPR